MNPENIFISKFLKIYFRRSQKYSYITAQIVEFSVMSNIAMLNDYKKFDN